MVFIDVYTILGRCGDINRHFRMVLQYSCSYNIFLLLLFEDMIIITYEFGMIWDIHGHLYNFGIVWCFAIVLKFWDLPTVAI